MVEYSNSQATKTSLIEAAGELFAEKGASAVTTREIAKTSGENIGSIHYHFGGKDGLIDASLDFAIDKMKGDPMGRYFKANESLLSETEGQKLFISGLIDKLFETTFSPEKPKWCATFVFQTLQREQHGADRIAEEALRPCVMAFTDAYARITGDPDFVKAHLWFQCVTSPIFIVALNPDTMQKFFPEGKIPSSYFEDLKNACKRTAFFGLGLLAPAQ